MTVPSVCAVIVTFHPSADVLENLRRVLPRFTHLLWWIMVPAQTRWTRFGGRVGPLDLN